MHAPASKGYKDTRTTRYSNWVQFLELRLRLLPSRHSQLSQLQLVLNYESISLRTPPATPPTRLPRSSDGIFYHMALPFHLYRTSHCLLSLFILFINFYWLSLRGDKSATKISKRISPTANPFPKLIELTMDNCSIRLFSCSTLHFFHLGPLHHSTFSTYGKIHMDSKMMKIPSTWELLLGYLFKSEFRLSTFAGYVF